MVFFLVRYGEISIKGQNKSFFLHQLYRNIRQKIPGNLKIKQGGGRIYLQSFLSEEEMINHLQKIPGIVSFSPVIKVEPRMESICECGLEMIKKRLSKKESTFRVTTRRTDKTFPIPSMELSREVGAYILRNTEQLKVHLKEPDQTLFVEVRKEGTFLYNQIIEGVGGLPVGTSSRALLLLSGGIDSPVAGWLGLKRGVQIEALYFHSPPFVSERSKKKVIDLCKALLEYGNNLGLTVLSLTPTLEYIKEMMPEKYTITMMRRMMMRMAEALAEERRIPALITGESIGQVASQTLENLQGISVIKIPVLRPLSGMDKMEIIALARKIGTYPISERPYEDCCSLFIPKHPVLKPKIKDLDALEERMPVSDLIEEALRDKEFIKIE